MAFCGNCGAPLNGEKYCPQCGAPAETSIGTGEERNSRPVEKKSAARVIVAIATIALIVFGIYTIATTSDEPCDWCHGTPTKVYKMSDGSESYVCAKCRGECAWCGDRATKHYENLVNMMVFVCNDCYHDIVD